MGNRSPDGPGAPAPSVPEAQESSGAAAMALRPFSWSSPAAVPRRRRRLPPLFYPPLPEPEVQFLRVFLFVGGRPAETGLSWRGSCSGRGAGPGVRAGPALRNRMARGAALRVRLRRGAAAGLRFARRAFRTSGTAARTAWGCRSISASARKAKNTSPTRAAATCWFSTPPTQPIRAITLPDGMKPCDAVWNDGELFVADLKSNAILVLDPVSGRLLRQFGKAGSAPGEFFSRPTWPSGRTGACT